MGRPYVLSMLGSVNGGNMRANHRIQATAGGASVLKNRVGRSPAAPDAERSVDGKPKEDTNDTELASVSARGPGNWRAVANHEAR